MEDVPTIITQQYVDFRSAQTKCSTSYASVSSSLPYTFHALQSHMAVTADGSVDETYLRVAVEHVVRECIPVEEWQAETERSIIREVIVNLLIQNFFGLLAQPWFWMKIALESLGPLMEAGLKESTKKKPRKKFNFHVVLVYFLSALQTFSGFALSVVAITVDAYHLMWKSHVSTHKAKEKDQYPSLLRPSVDALSEVLTLRSRHASSAVLSLLSGLIDMFTPFANALAHRILETHLTQDAARQILINTKRVMFPNNGYPAPRPEDPSLEEQAELRDKLERRLNEIGASHGLPLILGQSAQQRQQTIRDILDPLSLASCNTHLLLYLFDSALLALFPGLSLDGQPLSIEEDAPSQSGQLTPPDPFFPP